MTWWRSKGGTGSGSDVGAFLKPGKDGSLDVWVGKGIAGERFDGSKLKNSSGAQTYTHLNFERKGSEFVSRRDGGSVYRAAGQMRQRSIKAATRKVGSSRPSLALQEAKSAQRRGSEMKAVLNRQASNLPSQRSTAIQVEQVARQMVKDASRVRSGLSPKQSTALGVWRQAASSAEGLAKTAAGANEAAIKLAGKAAEAAAKAATAQAELDAKLAAAAAEQATKAAAKAAEEAAKQAAKTAEALGRTAAKTAEAAVKAAAVATEATVKATAAATEATIRAAAYVAVAAVAVVVGDR